MFLLKFSRKTKYKSSGFTLLEVLLVIGVIAVLSGVVMLAVNPGRQLAQTRNTQRQLNITEINKALQQYYIDNGEYPSTITTTLTEICNTSNATSTHSVNCTDLIDLSSLVATYLVAIPADPQATGTGSGYKIKKNSQDKIYITAILTELVSDDISVGPIPPVCSSFTYSSWSSCANYTQTRTVTASSPVDCLGGSPVLSQSCSMIPTDGLIAYWPFNSNATDSIGGYNGTLVNSGAVTYSSGILSNAVDFLGTNGYVSLANSVSVSSTYTFSMWVKPRTAGALKGIFYGNNCGVRFTNDTTRHIHFYGKDWTGSTYALPLDTWTHVVITDDGTSLKYYFNGTLDVSRGGGGSCASINVIGYDAWNNSGRNWDGLIDEFRIYNRALTSDEVSTIYEEESL